MISRAGHASHVARKLGDIVKLPLLRKEPAPRIKEIWAEYHSGRADAVARTLEETQATLLVDRAQAAPLQLVTEPHTAQTARRPSPGGLRVCA